MTKHTASVVRIFATRLLASTAALAAVASMQPASAQAGATSPAADAATDQAPDQAIVVIGTRRTDRSVANSASPVDVISSADIQAQPATNMLDVIKNIAPSFFVPQNTISDASSFVRSPSLRGLPGDEVLVMINGKRYNRSALVQVYSGGDTGLSYGAQASDLSAIPAIAIGNLQILRDGATAQYGSDAIAGVLNFGLRQDPGFELQGTFGENDAKDGDQRQVDGYAGVKLGDKGFITLAGEYYNNMGTSRGATRPSAKWLAINHPELAAGIPNYPNEPAQIFGSSPSHGYKLVLNAQFDVTPNSHLYAFGNYAYSKTNESFNYRTAITATGLEYFDGTSDHIGSLGINGAYNPVYLTPCPTGIATCPAGGFVKGGNTFSAANFYPSGFTPRFVGVVREAYGTAGYKGKLDDGFTWDLSGSLSKNTLGLSMYDSISPSYGPASQTSFQFGKLIQKEMDFNADFSYPLNVGLYSPVTISAGGEYRKETYESTAGDPQSYGAGPYATPQALYALVSPGVYTPAGTSSAQSPGASGYGGTSPDAAGEWNQKSWAAYFDIETDIIDGWSVGVAGRHEHYNQIGNANVGKVNTLFKVTPWLSIRGTAGTGFHAPSPGQSHTSILTTNFISGNQVQTGTYPVSSPASLAFGATPLRPEKSKNWGAGVVLQPARALTITADYYSIKVDHRIFISQPFVVTQDKLDEHPELAAVGLNGNVSYFTNGLDTLTRGVDVVATYHLPLGEGQLNLTLAYNYNKSTVSNFNPAVIDQAQIIDIKHLAPNHRATFSANWAVGPFVINGRENFYGSWVDAVDYPTATNSSGATIAGQKFGSKFTSDFDISYTFAEKFTVTLGGLNVFDTYPDRIKATTANPIYASTGSLSDGEIYPRSGGPFGINGGYWYGRVTIKY
jgi:iron complex outermembrane receptor protein